MGADTTKLMDAAHRTEHDVILNDYMASQTDGVTRDDVIPQLAIVRDMSISKNRIVRAQGRVIAIIGRTVHTHVFAKHIPVTDPHTGNTTQKL